jgi:hypothetical protein
MEDRFHTLVREVFHNTVLDTATPALDQTEHLTEQPADIVLPNSASDSVAQAAN